MLEITPAFLNAALTRIKALGYRLLPLDVALAELAAGGAPGAPPFAVLTFDDGYRDNLVHALPVLERHAAPFTIYVTTGFAERRARLWWVELEEAHPPRRAGSSCGSATRRSPSPRGARPRRRPPGRRSTGRCAPGPRPAPRGRGGARRSARRRRARPGGGALHGLAGDRGRGPPPARDGRRPHAEPPPPRAARHGRDAHGARRGAHGAAGAAGTPGDAPRLPGRRPGLGGAPGIRRRGSLRLCQRRHDAARPDPPRPCRASRRAAARLGHGLWQDLRHLEVLLSGAAFALWNRGRRLNVA